MILHGVFSHNAKSDQKRTFRKTSQHIRGRNPARHITTFPYSKKRETTGGEGRGETISVGIISHGLVSLPV